MRTKKTPIFCKLFLYLFIFIFHQSIFSQNLFFKSKNIDSSFNLFTKKYQEVVYTHLNKTTYIKGESLGFTSYILNKKTKKLSSITKNLYCIITDTKNNVVKKKLIKVNKGVSNDVFYIDSLFTTGNYTFKAYTNWMLNFEQQNFYTETFRVIDPEKNKYVDKKILKPTIDAQFLPEGGHILNNTINTIGIVLKDEYGYGVPKISGELRDEKNNILTSFKVNQLGIGRFSFLAKNNKNYKIILSNNGTEQVFNFSEKIELNGVLLKTKIIKDEVLISLATNPSTYNKIKDKKYTVTIHNGSKISSLMYNFGAKLFITKKVNFKELNPGVNIITLFDENNNPISERLIFNYQNISIANSSKIGLEDKNDSLSIKLSYNSILPSNFSNLSVSVLPQNTKSYAKNTSLISQSLIKPYIKGRIENSKYYFLNATKKEKYDLDNLLLTQGWSSYNWSEIFNFTPNYSNIFEQGISVKINNIKDNTVLIHRLSNRNSEILSPNNSSKSIRASEFFPQNKENLFVSEIDKKGVLVKPSLYVQFYPNSIPLLPNKYSSFKPKPAVFNSENSVNSGVFNLDNKVEKLDEIAIKVNLEKERIENIKNKAFGKVYFFDDNDRKQNLTLAQFINIKGGFIANDNHSTGTFSVAPIIQATIAGGNGTPAVFLNGLQILNPMSLYMFFLENVDYIEIDRLGFSAGVRGGAGVIRVFTKNNFPSDRITKETVQKFDFPLTFSDSKKFYTPKYKNYENTFYRNYGVIDWFPNKKISKDGYITLDIKKPSTNFTLFIEGITENGDFIFEEKTIQLNE